MLRNVTTVLAALLIAIAPSARAQSSRPQFEVVSIKVNHSGSRAMSCCGGPGRLAGTNVTLGRLIRVAYNVQDFQVIGGPAWMESDRFDIEAKAADDSPGKQQTAIVQGPMLQSLLEDRFKLVVHHETRELPVYDLTVAKSGAKLKTATCITRDPNAPPAAGQRPSAFCGYLMMDNNLIRAIQIDMVHFTDVLAL
jgi:uncharacterized protein (TIGR03435 family)